MICLKFLQYLNFWFETSMKCSDSISEVPKHRSKLHILLPWVTVTLHRVSWLPACIVCLANLLLCSNHHWGHILFQIRDIHDINLIKNICTEKRIRRLKSIKRWFTYQGLITWFWVQYFSIPSMNGSSWRLLIKKVIMLLLISKILIHATCNFSLVRYYWVLIFCYI